MTHKQRPKMSKSMSKYTNRYHRIIFGAIGAGLLPVATIQVTMLGGGHASAATTIEHSTLFVSPVVGDEEPLPAVPSDTKTWAQLKKETETSFQPGVENVRLPHFQRMQDFESILTNEAPNSLARYLQETENTDLATAPWQPPLVVLRSTSTVNKDDDDATSQYVREITYMHPIHNPMEPPKA
jgi:hypothetical protein